MDDAIQVSFIIYVFHYNEKSFELHNVLIASSEEVCVLETFRPQCLKNETSVTVKPKNT